MPSSTKGGESGAVDGGIWRAAAQAGGRRLQHAVPAALPIRPHSRSADPQSTLTEGSQLGQPAPSNLLTCACEEPIQASVREQGGGVHRSEVMAAFKA